MQTENELFTWLVSNGPSLDEIEFDADYVCFSLHHMPKQNKWMAGYWYHDDKGDDISPNWSAVAETPWAALRKLANVVVELRASGFTKAKYQEETADIRAACEKMSPMLEEIFGFKRK